MDVLVAWLWQGAALTAAVAVTLRALPRASAATRHVVWWLLLASVVALPLLHVAWPAPVSSGVGIDEAPSGPTPSVIATSRPDDPAFTSSTGIGATPWVLPSPPDWLAALALGTWLGFVLLSSVRLARGVVHVRRLARGGTPVPEGREARLRLWMDARPTGRRMDLLVSRNVAVPCAVGLGRAAILVPRRMLASLSDEDLDLLVMHERAHLLRYDDWTRLLEALIGGLAGFHPAVAWIRRQIAIERETSCDDFVLKATGDARGYATCLAAAAEMLSGGLRPSHALAPGAWHSRGALERRVRRLIDRRHNAETTPSRAFAVASACALVLASQVLVQTAPIVRFAGEVPDEPARTGAADDPPAQVDLGIIAAPNPPQEPEREVVAFRNPAVVPVSAQAGPDSAGKPLPAAIQREPRSEAADPAADRAPNQAPAASSPPPVPDGTPRDFTGAARTDVELPAPLPVDLGARPASAGVLSASEGTTAPAAGGDRSPWSGVAQAGSNVGTGAKKAGQAVAGFFTRAGVAIGESFTR
jgi:beta-lactamase regulating signal transducer with metallopeptidase domain